MNVDPSDAADAEPPAAAGDGFHHPASEGELIALVKLAHREGRQLRVRGAAHSVSHALYTDPVGEMPNRVEQQHPPPGPNLNLMLDRYRGWEVRDEGRRLVEAQAGIHLGRDPSDPTGGATRESSLLWQLWKEKGWALADTGGITHQTLSGFTATGSAGGSLRFSANENLFAFRVIDGTGEVREFSREDPDPDLFYAHAPSLGLLGVVSTITLECVETFNITGQEAITTVADCPVDVFGGGSPGRPSVEGFLREQDYARLEWWPQRGGERILTWQAQPIPPQVGFVPKPYQEFTDHPEAAELAVSILYTVLGNLDDLSEAREKLSAAFDQLTGVLAQLPEIKELGGVGELIARFLSHGLEFGVDAAIAMLEPFASLIRAGVPTLFPRILAAFVPLDAEKPSPHQGEPQSFQDWAWHGLPMDDEADDALVPTEFTEMWIPLPRAGEAMACLRNYLTAAEDDAEAYRRTGLYAFELYASMPTRFWLNASHSSGADEWRDGAFRIDIYWFAANPGNPAETFYPQFWKLIREAGIPLRLHWGKFQPVYPRGERDWVDFFAGQYPRWEDFLALRAERDPNNIFLTAYWRDRLGLWDAPEPRPTGEAY
ncbi:MAG: hypothetical protein QOF77_855 [Solirubrobacteraceae bacterium]|jgi:D-arabinono-1,4-lactone oxidase|nr:hypothetical protein [Solirubrobacteraceae bacterium]